MESQLMGAGLSKNESKVYLTLLKKGSALVGEITNLTGIHRRNVYDCIARLMEKGLVGYIEKDNKKYFKAAKPVSLLDMIDHQQDELKKKKQEINSLLPSLLALGMGSSSNQRVQVFEGMKGLMAILEDVIKTGKTNLVFSTSEILDKFYPYLERFHEKRIKAKVRDKIITSPGDKERAKGLNKMPRTEVRIMPKEFDAPLAINVYGGKVGMLIFSEKPISILIEDENVAKSFEKYFKLLWEMAEAPE